ncbi:MAG: hypothetical protein GX122_05645 [Candidatus Cloacimonetes bacterium]|nr:hypothetical protein [Candidatus Cloacimonadota bacterium]
MFQLSFLHTSLLIFAAATVLPLLIWLIAKRKPPRVVFSSLRFIRLSAQEEKKRSKLQEILLLIIRMLIILLFTLAVARPQVFSSRLKQSGKHPPTALAIVVDNSFGMDYLHEAKTALDRSKEALEKINALTNSTDKVIILTLDESWNTQHGQSYAGKIPGDIINSIAITHLPLSMEAAMDEAHTKLVESGIPNRELYLLTDRREADYPADFPLPVHLIPLTAPQSWQNLSIKDVTPLPQLVDKTRQQSLQFTLANHGDALRTDVLIRAVLGETKVAEKFVSIPARQEIKETILIELRQDGWQTGYVEVVDERLMHDNRSYFAFPHRLNPSLAVITQDASLPFYLQGALDVYRGGGKLKLIAPDALVMADLEEYQNFVIYKPGPIGPRLKEFIESLRHQKRGAVVFLDENMGKDLASWWSSMFDCQIGGFLRDAKELSYFNPHHYVSSLLGGTELSQKRVNHYWSCQASGSVALAKAGKDDLVLAKDNMILFALDPAAMQNSFFIGPIFPVLAYRALEHSGLALAGGNRIELGDLITAQELTLPDGSVLQLANRSYRAGKPGIYHSRIANGEATAIAVDYHYQESENNPQDYQKLKYIKSLKADWQKQLFRSRLGYDIWKTLFLVALALFLLEIGIIKLASLKAGKSPKELT